MSLFFIKAKTNVCSGINVQMGIGISKIINNIHIPTLKKVQELPKEPAQLATDIFVKATSELTVPKVFKGSSVSMHHALNGYNTDIREYLSNPNLTRKWRQIANEYTKELIESIDKEFANLPPTTQKHIVYRGRTEHPVIERFNTDFPIIFNAKIGDEVVPDLAYSYTGFFKSLAQNWASPSNFTKSDGTKVRTMIQEIILPAGSKVSRNLEHGGEVIMPRGAKYKILNKEIDKNGILNVTMEYLLPKT